MVPLWTLGRYHSFLLGTAAWCFGRISVRRKPCGGFRDGCAFIGACRELTQGYS